MNTQDEGQLLVSVSDLKRIKAIATQELGLKGANTFFIRIYKMKGENSKSYGLVPPAKCERHGFSDLYAQEGARK